ncbi:MAG: radical SAM protein [Verrucomicrobiae bacterium]|nr:radical SAM protein [Verrucomicrobiae bacterium]
MEKPPEPRLTVNEIYKSIQGESTFAGLPCVFIRLTFCNLRCTYCDTAYAFYDGEKMEMGSILQKVEAFECPLVELTGGEPLLQPGSLPLMAELCRSGKTVLLETGGSLDISPVDPRVHIIMDLKCPSSGECAQNRRENIGFLRHKDEVKFVIGTREDYEWACGQVREHELQTRVGTVLFSPVFGALEPKQLVNWILEDQIPVRFQLQMHKVVWPKETRGV